MVIHYCDRNRIPSAVKKDTLAYPCNVTETVRQKVKIISEQAGDEVKELSDD